MAQLFDVWFTTHDGRVVEKTTIEARGVGEMHRKTVELLDRFREAGGSAARGHFRAVRQSSAESAKTAAPK